MPRHPTIDVPNIGPMDHAWDLLGEWHLEIEHPELRAPVGGTLVFSSWTEAELRFDPDDAVAGNLPPVIDLERASRIHLTDAGGGALQWVLLAPAEGMLAQVTLWPGSIHLFVQDADHEDRQLLSLGELRDALVGPPGPQLGTSGYFWR